MPKTHRMRESALDAIHHFDAEMYMNRDVLYPHWAGDILRKDRQQVSARTSLLNSVRRLFRDVRK